MDFLICPVCGGKLKKAQKCYYCGKKHSFDIAKSGYINLLLSNHMNVKNPGDSKEMVAARRSFLDGGYYKPLCDGICSAALKSVNSEFPVILDTGCGEGYYTSAVYSALENSGKSPCVFGIDISKNALAAAEKRLPDKPLLYAVSSLFRLPLADKSCDLLLNVFAPFCREEFLRVMKKDARLIMVIPSTHHLWGLKKAIYDTPYLNSVKSYEIKGMTLVSNDKIGYQITINEQEQLNNLFTMTPYYYKTSPENSTRVFDFFKTHSSFSTEIEFEILTYKKN